MKKLLPRDETVQQRIERTMALLFTVPKAVVVRKIKKNAKKGKS